MTDQAIEKEIQAKGANVAPRITPEDVDAAIVGETFTVLPSGRVTVCELTLRNGFTVRGESAVVFIENFNAEIGKDIARNNARSQIWQLLGYQLRDRLHKERDNGQEFALPPTSPTKDHMSNIIKPTIGRRVWYWPTATDLGLVERANGDPSVMEGFDPAQPCDAGIAFVWNDRMVNLTVADHNGNMHRRCSVILVQPGEERPNGAHATWMPYQVGQAKPSGVFGGVLQGFQTGQAIAESNKDAA